MSRGTKLQGLGDRIRERRELRGLTVKELANRIGISRSYVNQLETVQGKNPSAEILYRMAEELHTTIGYLLGFEDHREPEYQKCLPEISPSLRRFAQRMGLLDTQVQMLAGIHYHGRQPQTESDWAFLWEAIKRAVTGGE